MYRKLLLVGVLVVLLGSAEPLLAFAPDGSPGLPPVDPMRNTISPDYVFTEEILRHIAEKDARAQSAYNKALAQQELKGFIGKTLSVGTWLEPNDYAHRNYCGPGATQVALDARLPAFEIPDIDTIGEEEDIDPASGVWLSDVRNVLNTRLSTSFYEVAYVGSQSTLNSRLMYDIDTDFAMVTGCNTADMPGWGGYAVDHIVPVYGYLITGTGVGYYTETSGSVAGYTGSYRQSLGMDLLYQAVSANPWHVW